TGYFEWTPSPDTVDDPGADSKLFSFTFSASDGQATVQQTVKVRVLHVDRPPQVFASSHALQVGKSFSIPVTKGGTQATATASGGIVVNDLDGSVQTQGLTVAFDNLPQGAVYNAQAGTLSWTPGAGQVGDYIVTARVTDSFGTTSTQTFTLRVAADASANAPKVSITTTPSMPAQPGQTVLTTVRASSYGNIASLTVQVKGAGVGAADWTTVTLNDAGQFSLSPTLPGIVNVRVVATDVDGFTTTQTGTVLVADPTNTSAPALSWGGALQGDWGTNAAKLPPVVINSPSLLQAQILANRQGTGRRVDHAERHANRRGGRVQCGSNCSDAFAKPWPFAFINPRIAQACMPSVRFDLQRR
ncbi:MAG: hypothetical protein JO142_20250, partial [Burkholderiales bacterium]|nr:hypothetical protein [Burkholderiales bacterium]